jgi:epoxyqueuosine reductase QueG
MDEKRVVKEVVSFVKAYSKRKPTKTDWKQPLVGFASADDPLFPELREVVQHKHALPGDLLPAARTVVAFFLPFQSELQKENARAGLHAARSWAVAYVETNRLIRDLSEHLKVFLEGAGFQATLIPPTHNFDPEILMSNWSHRHIAYIAGLGRFGVNHWLITEKGCSGRFGSLVTDAYFPPSSRQEQESCLHLAGYECGACVKKCVYGALYIDRFDRHACYRQLLKNDSHFSDLEETDVCGKCGCGLPCSLTNPVAKRDSRRAERSGQKKRGRAHTS